MFQEFKEAHPKHGVRRIVLKVPSVESKYINPSLFNYINYSDKTLKQISKIKFSPKKVQSDS